MCWRQNWATTFDTLPTPSLSHLARNLSGNTKGVDNAQGNNNRIYGRSFFSWSRRPFLIAHSTLKPSRTKDDRGIFWHASPVCVDGSTGEMGRLRDRGACTARKSPALWRGQC